MRGAYLRGVLPDSMNLNSSCRGSTVQVFLWYSNVRSFLGVGNRGGKRQMIYLTHRCRFQILRAACAPATAPSHNLFVCLFNLG
jgi:hypothetical protein